MWECACGGMVMPHSIIGTRSTGRCKKCGAESIHHNGVVNQYTPEEQQRIDALLQGAADAEEVHDLDELESFAARQRERWGHD